MISWAELVVLPAAEVIRWAESVVLPAVQTIRRAATLKAIYLSLVPHHTFKTIIQLTLKQ